ncbi:MAG: aldehyde dehydrogenase family protein [Lachnospiraceae bacterium]|nr:aldehyde dehydrogenase family protein [Lachnospiraceae bacterium]
MDLGKMFIDGEWVESSSGETRKILNPYDASVICEVAEGTSQDAEKAIAAARRAFYEDGWGDTPAYERAELLKKFADEMEANVAELARLETLNTGKALIESEYDVYDSANILRYYAGLVTKPTGQTYDLNDPNVHAMTVREPIGVCALIVAWNFPISLAIWKVAPALAAGNTIILKPSKTTPLSAIKMVEMREKVGFPKGVGNLVLGAGAGIGNVLAESMDVDKVAFTGSIKAGREVMRAAASNVKGICLELGGKSPNIIFADADFDTAVDYGLYGMFYNQGEVCSAGSRILVEDTIYDKYLEKLIEGAKKIRIGNGLDEGVRMGPVISEHQMKKVLEYIEIGKKEGATVALGGYRMTGQEYEKGYFIAPTIFTDTTPDMRIVQEEIFGPVVVIQKFHGEEEAIRLANDTTYGLAAGVFSNDLSKALRVVKKLRAGITWINTYGPVYPEAPWGGYKQSGIGRELGIYGLDDYTEVKQININTNVCPSEWFD